MTNGLLLLRPGLVTRKPTVLGRCFVATGALALLWACSEEPTAPTDSTPAGRGGTAGQMSSVDGHGGSTGGAPTVADSGEGGQVLAGASGAGGSDPQPAGGVSIGGAGGVAPSRGGTDSYGGNRAEGEVNGSGHSGGDAGGTSGEAGEDGGAHDGGAGQNDGGDGALDRLAVSGLTIEANPNMTISCFVSWTTNLPSSSEVDFGTGAYQFRIHDATLTMNHRVLVIGMHAATEYKIKAYSATTTSADSAEGVFTTGPLPPRLAQGTITIDDPAKRQIGWTLVNASRVNTDPAFIGMYDEQGLPVWYYVDGPKTDTRGDIATEFLGSSVLIGPSGEPVREVDLSGAVIWEGPTSASPSAETHEVRKTSVGNYLINTDLWLPIGGTQKIDGFVQEIKPDWTEVWSWHFFDHYSPTDAPIDSCHGNAMTFDEANDVLYYNCRFLGLYKIRRSTGDVVWRLGGSYDTTTFGAGDFSFEPPESQFSDTHAPELHADGTILVFDNGGYSDHSAPGQYHSRVVEYDVDQIAKTATRTFEFPGSFPVDAWYKTEWYTPIFGSAKRLDNGNILICAASSIFEVTRAGEVVWRMNWPGGTSSYRAQRISRPPLVERLP